MRISTAGLRLLLLTSVAMAVAGPAAISRPGAGGTLRAEDDSEPWSFRPPVRRTPPRPEAPPASDARSGELGAWAREPADRFIQARLAEAGLAPQAAAGRAAIARRLTFDLTGLPPAPDELADHAADESPDAVERLVDRLLASPAHGERWARHWLDVVRFAESNGFETNTPRRNAWPYRDWVIRALNEDLPYDRFVTEQLAGDATGEDAATGFLVAGPFDTVKSPDVELTLNQRANEIHDMVSVTAQTFLGLTAGCARCHDHKFDPISQRDYYSLAAVFAGVEHGEREWRREDQADRERRAAELRSELARIDRARARWEEARPGTAVLDDEGPIDAPAGAAVAALHPPAGKVEIARGRGPGEAQDPGAAGRAPPLAERATRWSAPPRTDVFACRPGVSGRLRIWISWVCTESSCADARYGIEPAGAPGGAGAAAGTRGRVEIARVDQRRRADGSVPDGGAAPWSGFHDCGVHDLAEGGSIVLRTGDAPGSVTAAAIVVVPAGGERAVEATASPVLRPAVDPLFNFESFTPIAARFVRFTVLETNSLEPCIDELEVFTAEPEPRNVALATAGARLRSSSDYPPSPIHKLEHLNDGRYGNGRSWISGEVGRGWVEIELAEETRIGAIAWARDREGVYRDRLATRYRIEVAAAPGEWREVASSADRLPWRAAQSAERRGRAFGLPASAAREYEETLARRGAVAARLEALTASRTVYAGVFKEPPPTHLLRRGDPMQPRGEVAPGAIVRLAPEISIPAGAGDRERRLALARWITDPANPLTARVAVNRVWQHHFGAGLVPTPSDLGVNGARPTHLELLDWLALELVERGWSLKRLHRSIVLSSAYRQSSASNEAAARIDAHCRLLWRHPPRRLEAEAIRDAILAASGALGRTMGGPGFDVFEPNDNYVHVYVPRRSFGAEHWRRMIYQWKPRTEQDETFGVFDCPDAAQPAPRRGASTTPLQALNLLNSPFVLEQARIFAARLELEAPEDPEAQVDLAFRIALGREPAAGERDAALSLARSHGLWSLCRALFNAAEFIHVS